MRLIILSVILMLAGCSEDSTEGTNGSKVQNEDRFPETQGYVFSETPAVDQSKARCDENSLDICQDNLNFWVELTNFTNLGDPLVLC